MLWLEKLESFGIAPFRQDFPDSPPIPLVAAVDRFNSGLYWGCHETLEDLWRITPYPLRHFYQAVIKIAVGFHHNGRHNAKGTRNKLSEGMRLLKPFTPTFLGLDTDFLAQDVQDWLQCLQEGPHVNWAALGGKKSPIIRAIA